MKKPKQKPKRTSPASNAAPRRPNTLEKQQIIRRRRMLLSGLTAIAFVLGAGALAYFAIGSFFAPTHQLRPQSVVSTASAGSQFFDQAKVQIATDERELGAMDVSEERTADFLLHNTGGKPLEISQVRTSCMCTFAQVIVDREESPLFNMEMHNRPAAQSWKGVVAPGHDATIRVIYRPSLMPVQGSVARRVTFNTNDPDHQVVELDIHATVR